MHKQRHLIGFSVLLVWLLLPASAAAAPTSVAARSSLESAIGRFLGMVSAFLFGEAVEGRCSVDPWGCPAGTNDADLVPGWDPWGSPAPLTGADDSDLGWGMDPDGVGHLWDPWG